MVSLKKYFFAATGTAGAATIAAFLSQSPELQTANIAPSDLKPPAASDTVKPAIIDGYPVAVPATGKLSRYTYMKFGSAHDGLYGHKDYCDRVPKECMTTSKTGLMVRMPEEIFERVNSVNLYINRMIEPGRDENLYPEKRKPGNEGVDYWTLPNDGLHEENMRGDCEDYVLLKMRELRDMGIPNEAMSIVFVDTGKEGHAVLAIRTDRGDMILDNLSDKILYPKETGYKFIAATSMENNREWRTVEFQKLTMQDMEVDRLAGLDDKAILLRNGGETAADDPAFQARAETDRLHGGKPIFAAPLELAKGGAAAKEDRVVPVPTPRGGKKPVPIPTPRPVR